MGNIDTEPLNKTIIFCFYQLKINNYTCWRHSRLGQKTTGNICRNNKRELNKILPFHYHFFHYHTENKKNKMNKNFQIKNNETRQVKGV